MEIILKTEAYGPHPSQQGDLYLPDHQPLGVICLLHGGFWRMPYGREELAPLAQSLCNDGFIVWNLEYRRVGDDGGWPNTFLDVATGVDHLVNLNVPLDRLIIAGHSAGGHLALWSAKRNGFPGIEAPRTHPKLIIGLAPIADLIRGDALGVGNGAVRSLMGSIPVHEKTNCYNLASPQERLPLGVPQIIIHGEQDDFVPIALSEHYVEAAQAAGDDIRLIRLAKTGHMEFLDPENEAARLMRSLLG